MLLSTPTLALFWGFYMILASSLFILKPSLKDKMYDVLKSKRNQYFFASLALLIGVIHIVVHNSWETPLEKIISGIGYLILLKGLAGLVIPNFYNMSKPFISGYAFIFWILLMIIFAVYLLLQGFSQLNI